MLQHRDHRQRRLRPLVAIAAVDAQAVAAAAGPLVQHRDLGVVVAEEPRHAQADAVQPARVAGHRRRAGARVRQRGDLDRPLVEAGALLARAPAADRDDRQVPVAGLARQQPLQHAQAAAEHGLAVQLVADHDDRLRDRRVGVAQPRHRPGPGGVVGRLADDGDGVLEEAERARMTGQDGEHLGRAENRERHRVRQRRADPGAGVEQGERLAPDPRPSGRGRRRCRAPTAPGPSSRRSPGWSRQRRS